METNIWFYTFSTSAQVMAALVGLFAVFVVYKIQDFSEVLSGTRKNVIDILSYLGANTTGFLRAFSKQDAVDFSDSEILKRFEELLIIKENEPARVKTDITNHEGGISFTLDRHTYQFYQNLFNKRSLILSKLKKVLTASFLAIVFSIFAIIATESLYQYSGLLWFFLIYLIFCFWLIGKGIYDVTSE